MKLPGKQVHAVLLAVVVVLLPLAPSGWGGEQERKSQVGGLIRALGYGGAIQNVKNFVLRGDAKYQAEAEKSLAQSEEIIAGLRKDKELSDRQRAALDGIAEVVGKYKAALPEIKRLHGEGKSVREVDQAIKIDDSRAISGIDVLRSEHTWSKREQLEHVLGYGGVIHAFKNGVLRGDKKYLDAAGKGIAEVEAILADLRKEKGISSAERSAVDGIEQVVKAYQGASSTVAKLAGDGKDSKTIDAAVRINDAPALSGLAVLRQR